MAAPYCNIATTPMEPSPPHDPMQPFVYKHRRSWDPESVMHLMRLMMIRGPYNWGDLAEHWGDTLPGEMAIDRESRTAKEIENKFYSLQRNRSSNKGKEDTIDLFQGLSVYRTHLAALVEPHYELAKALSLKLMPSKRGRCNENDEISPSPTPDTMAKRRKEEKDRRDALQATCSFSSIDQSHTIPSCTSTRTETHAANTTEQSNEIDPDSIAARIGWVPPKSPLLRSPWDKPSPDHTTAQWKGSMAPSHSGANPEDAVIQAIVEECIIMDTQSFPLINSIIGSAVKTEILHMIARPFRESPGFFSLLLYGPPGTGKSTIAKAIARLLRIPMFYVVGDVVASSYRDRSTKICAAIFRQATKLGPCVIFFDEAETLFGSSETNDIHKDEKCTMLPLIADAAAQKAPIILIIATNNPWSIGASFYRRFSDRIYVALPTLEDLEVMIQRQINELALSQIKLDINIPVIAKVFLEKRFSGSDVERVLKGLKKVRAARDEVDADAALEDFDEYMRSVKATPIFISHDFALEYIQKLDPGISAEAIAKYTQWQAR